MNTVKQRKPSHGTECTCTHIHLIYFIGNQSDIILQIKTTVFNAILSLKLHPLFINISVYNNDPRIKEINYAPRGRIIKYSFAQGGDDEGSHPINGNVSSLTNRRRRDSERNTSERSM